MRKDFAQKFSSIAVVTIPPYLMRSIYAELTLDASSEKKQKLYIYFQVLHSQRMSEKPLQPWIIAEKDGRILAAHCTCMAGFGEACTHVAALFFCC